MRRFSVMSLAVLLLIGAVSSTAFAADGQKLQWTGTNYTKWLWGTQRYDGSMYNFTTIPGEGYGDNGQATEFEMLIHSRPSSQVEVNGRIKSRFNQNEWTNYGGFGGHRPAWIIDDPSTGAGHYENITGGDGGEFDPRSNEYIKLRGLTITITPGYSWINRATIGSSDFGMFDAFTIGKIRYIDRDNAKGLIFQGSFEKGKYGYDLTRISLPRLWAGFNFITGDYTAQDACYGAQLKFAPTRSVNFAGVFDYVNDIEIDPADMNPDNGTSVTPRSRNAVFGLRAQARPQGWLDLSGAAYYSSFGTADAFTAVSYGFGSFGSTLVGKHSGWAGYANANLSDPLGVGFNLNVQYFNLGSEYESVMAARRESDVLLTEGHDGTFAYPGPNNAKYGVFGGNPSVIGYGGWLGHDQQVATINVDNEFTDFDEPLAETCIGWKGITAVPEYTLAGIDLSGEFSYIDYNTNWQNWGMDLAHNPFGSTPYPTNEPGTGFGSYRNAYNPFQDRTTYIYVLKANYLWDVANGVDLHAKWKYIDDQDLRMNDQAYLDYVAPGQTTPYFLQYFSDPTTPGQWKTFDSLSDDDKQMAYRMFSVGGGYQLTSELHVDATWEHYNIDMVDGTTAFQAYNLHEMTSGKHVKNNLIGRASYIIGGTEFGGTFEYSFGRFSPNFGPGFTPVANADGVMGFYGRYGGWNSVEQRDFAQVRLKAYMKLNF